MDGFLAFSARVKDLIQSALGWIASVTLLVLTLFALLEIVRRYIFGLAYEWGHDASVVGMITAVAFYFCVTQIQRNHLVMNAIVQLAYSRGYHKAVAYAKIFASAIIVLFCGSIGVTGWPTLSYAWSRDLSTYSLLIPLWPFYLFLMIGLLLMAFVALLQLVEDTNSLISGKYVDEEFEAITDV